MLHILLVNNDSYEQAHLVTMLKQSGLGIFFHKVALDQDFKVKEIAGLFFDVLIIDFDALDTDFYNGNDFVKNIPYKVILSSRKKDALKAFKFNAFDFFDKKTMSPLELIKILVRIKFYTESVSNTFQIKKVFELMQLDKKISFRVMNSYYLIKPNEIVYIKSHANGCLIHVQGNDDFISTEPLLEVKRKMPKSVFVAINKEMILNLMFLSRINLHNNTFTIDWKGKNEVFPIDIIENYKL